MRNQKINGILPLHKPKGMTSHDCVFQLRKLLHMKKVGHTGTLDPEVTGILPICLGRATKIAEYITNYPKTYQATVTLGYSTTTEDQTGDIVEEKPVGDIDRSRIKEVVESFHGNIEQIPPMFSAVKVNGKKLYEYAREGITIDRPARQVHIYRMDLDETSIRKDRNSLKFNINVMCSKGTYIRTLAVDIGEKLGYPAHMSALIRTKSGPFTLEQGIDFDTIKSLIENDSIEDAIYSISYGLQNMPNLKVDENIEKKILNGAVLPLPDHINTTQFLVKNQFDEVLAIYQSHPTKHGLMKPVKVIKVNNEEK